MTRRKFLWVAVVAAALLVLASSLIYLGGSITANSTQSSSQTPNFSFRNTVNLGFSDIKTATGYATGGISSPAGRGSSKTTNKLQVYSDSACTIPVTSINWGSISPGGKATTIVYVKNTEKSSSLTLSIQASNWNPTSASQYLTLSWDKQGTVLPPGQSTEATITLTVSSGITGITSFDVQISISGTG